jgi:predicted DNA-binding protein
VEELVRYKELRVRIPADLHSILKEISEKTGVSMSKIIEYALDQYVLSIIKEDLPLEIKVAYIVRKIFDITQLQQRIDIVASTATLQPLVRNDSVMPIIYELQKVKEKLYSELVETAKKIEERIQRDINEIQDFTRFIERIHLREARMRARVSELASVVIDMVKSKEESKEGGGEEK